MKTNFWIWLVTGVIVIAVAAFCWYLFLHPVPQHPSSSLVTNTPAPTPTAVSATAVSVSPSVTATPTLTDSAIKTGAVTIDSQDTAAMQASVDQGHQPWRLDPLEVARADSGQYGFDRDADAFVLLSKEYAEGPGTYLADVRATHGGVNYLIRLIQPEKQGESGIWVINSITEQ